MKPEEIDRMQGLHDVRQVLNRADSKFKARQLDAIPGVENLRPQERFDNLWETLNELGGEKVRGIRYKKRYPTKEIDTPAGGKYRLFLERSSRPDGFRVIAGDWIEVGTSGDSKPLWQLEEVTEAELYDKESRRELIELEWTVQAYLSAE
jgi:hypothetical protein